MEILFYERTVAQNACASESQIQVSAQKTVHNPKTKKIPRLE